MTTLYTTFYDEQNPVRKAELLRAVELNLKCSAIDRIVVLNESNHHWSDGHLESIAVSRRPSYEDYFRIINERSGPDDIHIIANTDIFFDERIGVLHHLNWADTCLALTRWNVREDASVALFERNDSQDVWVFKGPVKPVTGDFPIGVPFCDNRILYELLRAGYRVLNPAFSIRCYHLHAGVRQEYDKATLQVYVEEPYRYLFPHNLFSLFGTLWFNLRHRPGVLSYRYDLKKANRWWAVRLLRFAYTRLTGNAFPLLGYPPR